MANAERTALSNQVQVQVINNTAAAQQQYNTDAARSLDDPVIAQVNPPPQSTSQVFL